MPNCTDCSKKGSVKVLIPIYKTDFSLDELLSIERTHKVLCNYPIVFIHPKSLNLSSLSEKYSSSEFYSFEDSFFKGIKGYNRLMLSVEFYSRFSDVDYILIAQTDTFVFRDELSLWCKKGFDYVGAPWLKKPIYDFPIIREFMSLSLKRDLKKGKPNKQLLYNKIGNGGFSLRKVESFLAVLNDPNYREVVERFSSSEQYHLSNEDVFWGTIPLTFKYPTVEEALAFAFDKYPTLSWRLNNKMLPFGCHGWNKRKMRGFWKRFNLYEYDGED